MQLVSVLFAALCFWQLYLWWLPTSNHAYALVVQFQQDKSWPNIVVPKGLAANFGRQGEAKQTVKPIDKSKPQAQKVMTVADVNIVVNGIVMMPEEAKSRAILSVQGGAAKVYRVGDELQRQMKLSQIKAKSLIVERKGETIELLFATKKTTQLSTVTGNRAAANRAVVKNNDNQSNSAIVIKSELRDVLIKNPMQATQYILAAPEFRNGKMHGYRLRKGRTAEVFEASGFQEGDVLTHIGDDHVSQISAGQLLGGNVLSQSVIPITLERQGTAMSLDIQIQ